MQIDLNCDLGESYGIYKIGSDQAMMPLVSSVNIACGFHGGDPNTMAETVEIALQYGKAMGAHPGYQDLNGFGRRNMDIKATEVSNLITYQVGALEAFVRSAGGKLRHVKPHGALYNQAAVDFTLADAIVRAIKKLNPQLILYGLSGSELCKAGKQQGLKVVQEAFIDRRYKEDGTLTPRDHDQAVIHDPEEALQQALSIIENKAVQTIEGIWIPLEAESLCLHGDNIKAVDLAEFLHRKLLEKNIMILPPSI
ncbi:LamB/YcsF family protein [Heliorestis acidaminivorans]|uniref:5-oxoprolinase subunit A n=1 Tax=Heliorestis acidaminivorans TaxID=553427 RepID=A0A6I0ER81_9FIRM|nr:5-oxoprolinase subunit PxpA [Heliorestis acidaminivorans]KAB2952869.1 LamB/YcsF family protein [Heliorestis acidaminivorans]